MSSFLLCASHSPLNYCYARKPDRWEDIEQVYTELKTTVEDFQPELVFAFGSDHFNGFFLKLMPAFCIGSAAEATTDIGGFSGRLDVPESIAIDSVNFLRANGLDPAISYAMTLDHAFSQTLTRVLGGLNRYPTVPIFINCITEPYVPFKRTRLMGEAIGVFISKLKKRVLLLASGGMSHHPRRYYPKYSGGDDSVSAWQLWGGDRPPSFTREEWLQRLEDMHHEGAEMITRGERTAADMHLNPEIDQRFLSILTKNELELFDKWDQEKTVAEGGIGFMELQGWLAAAAAHRAAGGEKPVVDIYAVTKELGIATGIVHAT